MKVRSLIPNEDALIEKKLKVLLIGPHGTGKTESIRGLAKRHGKKIIVFSGATMDPYIELLGVPFPHENEDGTRELRMVRRKELDEAQIVFFDEINRARPEVRNAMLEIMNEGSINGEELPNLESCWAAMNPPGEDYDVDELDEALIDRFDIYLQFGPRPSLAYMKKKMDIKTARAVLNWWKDHSKSKRQTYISPRRLVKIGVVFEAIKNKAAVNAALPPGGDYDHEKLWMMLTETKKSTKDAMLPGESKRAADGAAIDWADARTLKELKANPATLRAVDLLQNKTANTILGSAMYYDYIEKNLTAAEMANVMQTAAGKKRSAALRKGFLWMMGFGKGSNPTSRDGKRSAYDRKMAAGLPKMHAALNSVTRVKSSKLPPLSEMKEF